jgi:hypothetical protein
MKSIDRTLQHARNTKHNHVAPDFHACYIYYYWRCLLFGGPRTVDQSSSPSKIVPTDLGRRQYFERKLQYSIKYFYIFISFERYENYFVFIEVAQRADHFSRFALPI